MTCKLILMAALLVLVGGCSHHDIMRGANFLQDDHIAFENSATLESLGKLKQLGANTVAIVPFLRQSSNTATDIESDPHISDEALRKTIRWAKGLGFQVILKPQILVKNGWSGSISPDNWDLWFTNYGHHLVAYAMLAEEEHVDRLIIGTELEKAAAQPQWADLIRQLRSNYQGQLSYVAHGLNGIQQFQYWHQLDNAGVTLYPSLGENNTKSRRIIQETLTQLKMIKQNLAMPVWVAEVGIASRSQARQRPWAWQDLADEEREIDLGVQQEIIEMWLDALSVEWLDGVMLWAWYSDPDAGGDSDISFTIQNKPAERTVACRWSGVCQ